MRLGVPMLKHFGIITVFEVTAFQNIYILMCMRPTYFSRALQRETTLKGYCTVFQHVLKLLELTGIDLT